MAYEQGGAYEPPRRAYYGHEQPQQAPVRTQLAYYQQQQQQHYGHDQGYDKGFDQGYDDSYGQVQQHHDSGYGGYDNVSNGYAQDYVGQQQQHNGYAQDSQKSNNQRAVNGSGYGHAPAHGNDRGQPKANGYGQGPAHGKDRGPAPVSGNGYGQAPTNVGNRGQAPANGYGQVPSYGNGHGPAPVNGNGHGQAPVDPRQRYDDQYTQQHAQPVPPHQERYYDPRYQQRPGITGQASPNGHARDQRMQPAVQQQQYEPRGSSRQDPRNGYAPEQRTQEAPQRSQPSVTVSPERHEQRRAPPQPAVAQPSTPRGHHQSNKQYLSPVKPAQPAKPTKHNPKMSMEAWKASEKAKMHAAANGPETIAQDTAFPTFPTKKKESRSGESAMSMRSSGEQPRPSVSSSRPAVSRDNSYQDATPAQTEQNAQHLHRPSLERQPYSFEPVEEPSRRREEAQRPPPDVPQFQNGQNSPVRGAVVAVDAGRNQQQAEVRQPQQQYEHVANRRADKIAPSQARPRAGLPVDSTDTAHALARKPVAMGGQPLTSIDKAPRPSNAHARPPIVQQPQEQLFSPTSQYSQSDSPLDQRAGPTTYTNGHAEQHTSAGHHRPHNHSLDDVYAGYYDGEPAGPVQVAPTPKTREHEIEMEMPDFDSAAPGGTSLLHKRLQTGDRQGNGTPASIQPPIPAFTPPQTGNSAKSLPAYGQQPYMQHDATASQPNLTPAHEQSLASPTGFMFGVPGEHATPQQQYGTDPRAMRNRQYSQPQSPYLNEHQEGISMADARGVQMRGAHPGRPPPQGSHPGERRLLPQRPEFDRLGTAQTVMSDPGRQRVPSAPPMRQGLQPLPLPLSGQPIGAPLTQQRSAPGPVPSHLQSNQDALPQHPVPIRPGLMQSNTLPVAARPPPVRTYENQSISSMQSRKASLDVSDGPITLVELDRLRAAVEANPTSNKTALLYAKKLIEASSTLASDNGRLDAKTTQRNRENYILDAHKRIKRLVAAGYPEAQFFFADCYGQGLLGLEVDTKEAFNLYQAAAKAGHPSAAYRTAVCCEMGPEEGGGTRRDYPKAVQWYRRAAALGDVPAMFKLGMILLKGLLGTPRNVGEAASWLKRAAERADKDNPHALHELGLLYESGNSNPEIRNKLLADDKYALQLFRQAADLGYKQSQYRLGQAHEYGTLGLAIDNRASIGWYSKAAAQGEHHAELALSGWYLTGAEGILEHNETEAYLWARKAAGSEPPLAKAMFALGYFSEQGIGCPRDMDEARRWYGRAASYKFPKALERLEELKKNGGKGAKPTPANGKLTRKDQKKDEENCAAM